MANQDDNISADVSKRKVEDDFEAAKQKARELAAQILGKDAVSKRPRLSNSSEFAVASNTPYTVPQHDVLQGIRKKFSIPNSKVGVIIGRGGEMIRYLEIQAGAKINLTKDADADISSLTRDIELTGTIEQTTRAWQLIHDIIAEADAGGSASAALHAPNALQPGAKQVVVKVPNNKVAMLIGKRGETIKNIQIWSGARLQVIPLHLPPGDTSTERSVYINGLPEQIESAKKLITALLNGNRVLSPFRDISYMQLTGVSTQDIATDGHAQVPHKNQS